MIAIKIRIISHKANTHTHAENYLKYLIKYLIVRTSQCSQDISWIKRKNVVINHDRERYIVLIEERDLIGTYI